MRKLLYAILITLGLLASRVAIADSDVGARADWTRGQSAPTVDADNDPSGYFDWVAGQPGVVFEFQEEEEEVAVQNYWIINID